MISTLFSLLIIGLILAIIWWAVTQVPVPEPFSWVIRVVFALVVVVILVSFLTGGGLGFSGLHLGRTFC